MYIETSLPRFAGAKARLVGPHVSMDTASPVCWSFYFHLYGQDVGSLAVQVSGANNPYNSGVSNSVGLKNKRLNYRKTGWVHNINITW